MDTPMENNMDKVLKGVEKALKDLVDTATDWLGNNIGLVLTLTFVGISLGVVLKIIRKFV